MLRPCCGITGGVNDGGVSPGRVDHCPDFGFVMLSPSHDFDFGATPGGLITVSPWFPEGFTGGAAMGLVAACP